ncbi:MAG: GTPase RsgA [Firmicutes bacterium]|nr:GTPase RsgA [Bacillota bacterium]
MIKKCIGCGLTLQDSNKETLGYTPNLNNTYCMRCFRLKNYGEKKLDETINEENIITKVNKGVGVAFFLIDYLNINNYTLNIFKRIKIKKVLVISKIDVLRHDMKFVKISKWLKNEYNISDDILYLSTNKNYGVNSILNYMEKNNFKTGYILGITNAGKSTLINKILKDYNINKEIIISNKPNTTLDFIKLNIDNYVIYDTPGFTYPSMEKSIINKEIKPITYNITKETTINIKDYSINFKNPTSVTLYLNDNNITKTFKSITGDKLILKDNQDIVIPGVGYINIKNSGEVIINKIDNIEIRNSITGEAYE